MHIPENYLSPETCGVMALAMVPVYINAVKKVKNNLPKEKMPLIGVGAAFSFVAMMFNIPIFGGSTGHAVGGTLIAILLGPDAACIAISIALAIQAFIFGDGGILSLGANCFNMAFVLPYSGYFIYQLISKNSDSNSRKLLGAGIGSYIGINLAALCTAIEFGIQPLLFKDSLGNSLYCPYDLSISIPAMTIEHLTLFGLVEVIFTTGVYGFILKAQPELLEDNSSHSFKSPITYLLAGLIALVPLGLLAQGSAWGEWGIEEMESLVGYTPSGMVNGFSWDSLMPDYAIEGLPDVLTYYLSAIIGVGLLIIIFRLIANINKKA